MTNAATGIGTRTIISLGGSIIVPEEIDTAFLKTFKEIITERVALGDSFFIITGGGRTCRKYQAALRDLGISSNELGDWMGIFVTRLNGDFVRIFFGDMAYEELINDPLQYKPTTKPVIVGAGNEPGCSSDMDAVELAKHIGAKRVINLSNVSVVYDKDPKTHPDAKPMHDMTWEYYRSIIPRPEEWIPGLNTPFDPVASKLAEEMGIEVVIAKGTDTDNLKKILGGEEFVGTMIR